MNVSRRAWLSSVIGVGTVGAVSAAQRSQAEPEVLSGSDIGFMVQGVGRNNQRVGALVVRVDGKWVPVEFAPAMRTAR